MGDDALCQHCTGGPSSKRGGLFSEASYSFSLRFAEKLGLFVFTWPFRASELSFMRSSLKAPETVGFNGHGV